MLQEDGVNVCGGRLSDTVSARKHALYTMSVGGITQSVREWAEKGTRHKEGSRRVSGRVHGRFRKGHAREYAKTERAPLHKDVSHRPKHDAGSGEAELAKGDSKSRCASTYQVNA